MKKFLTIGFSLFLYFGMNAQTLVSCAASEGASGNCNLGSEITNGVLTDGCAGGCVGVACTSQADNAGNHPTETMTTVLAIPAGHSASISITSNNCGSTAGLDGGDDVFIDGVQVIDGASNLIASYSGCHAAAADGSGITIDFTANRRDETVNITWTSGPTNPAAPNGCHDAVSPVELINFHAQNRKDDIKLIWSTVSEVNNSFFDIEHSTDGNYYEAIGKVEGYGNSQEELNYEFEHFEPSKGNNYYRLRQVDFNGDYEFSDIVQVRVEGKGEISLFPNPVINALTISFGKEISNSTNIEIYSLSGKLLIDQNMMVEGNDLKIDLGTLTNGQYVLRLNTNNESITRRFVKAN